MAAPIIARIAFELIRLGVQRAAIVGATAAVLSTLSKDNDLPRGKLKPREIKKVRTRAEQVVRQQNLGPGPGPGPAPIIIGAPGRGKLSKFNLKQIKATPVRRSKKTVGRNRQRAAIFARGHAGINQKR